MTMTLRTPELCFFCGGNQDVQITYPMGGAYTASPDHCAYCRAQIGPHEAGIFEVTEQPAQPGLPELQPGVWYTGRWCVVDKKQLPAIYRPDVAKRVAQAGAGVLNNFSYRFARLDVYVKGALQ
jgi:hypothetical protein